jgi:hypothetical protein
MVFSSDFVGVAMFTDSRSTYNCCATRHRYALSGNREQRFRPTMAIIRYLGYKVLSPKLNTSILEIET